MIDLEAIKALTGVMRELKIAHLKTPEGYELNLDSQASAPDAIQEAIKRPLFDECACGHAWAHHSELGCLVSAACSDRCGPVPEADDEVKNVHPNI